MRFFPAILLGLGVTAAGVAGWAAASWNAQGPPPVQGNQSVVLIQPRTPLHDIASQLEDARVVKNGLVLEFNLYLRGLNNKVKAGEYAIPARASMADIAAILVSGKSIQHKLTAAEGLTSDMIYRLVNADPVLVGAAGPEPAEGTLLPETYLFTRGTSRPQMLERMARAQAKFLEARWAARKPDLPLRSREEAVTLASIVEKETSLPEERRHIAAVFLNRLRLGMRLQSDPTVIYSLSKGYPLGRGIRESELNADSPYNTYVIAGLPPGPISNPGKDSLAAVLDPMASDDLYFVATGRGGHAFAASLAEHAKNVAAWRAVEKKQEGETPSGSGGKPAPPRRHRHA